MTGDIDEVRLSNIARTLAEAQAAYNGGNGIAYTVDANTISLWHLNEGTGNPLDAAGNNNLTNTNATWVNTHPIYSPYTVNTAVISAGLHTIQVYLAGGLLAIKVDSDIATTTACTGNISNSSTTATWMSSNIFAYCDYITVYKSGVQSVLFQPAVMISGTTLPDSVGTADNGTITWGTNSGLTISYGALVSYSPTSSNASLQGGTFTPPTLTLASGWYGGNVTGGTFWSLFASMTTAGGMGSNTILMFLAIGVSMILGIIVFRASGSVLLSTLLLAGVLYFFSEMSIIPLALVFIFLLISVGIMYLVRLM